MNRVSTGAVVGCAVVLLCVSVLMLELPEASARAMTEAPVYLSSAGWSPPQEDCSKEGCHDGYKKKSVVHSPIADDTCDACHELVDEEKHTFKFTEPEEALCAQCHEELTKGLAFLHGPVAGGSCTPCHDPHASDNEKILRAESPEMCLECHEEVKENFDKAEHKHQPVEEDCTVCHHPHGGADRYSLRAKAPALCLECHDDVGETAEKAKYKHPAVTEGKSCLGCHAGHSSKIEKLLVAESMKLCLPCHSQEPPPPAPVGKGQKKKRPPPPSVGRLLEKLEHHHGPIQDEDCSTCHSQVHGGDSYKLLMGGYAPGFYAPFDEKRYGLCFECHESDLAKVERTTDATGFRNGDRNLHFVHVNKKVKGRTCRTCHHHHASDNPFHIRKAIPFGPSGWLLPTGFTPNDKGGSCTPGCHRAYGYDREKAIDNFPPLPPKPLPKIETPPAEKKPDEKKAK